MISTHVASEVISWCEHFLTFELVSRTGIGGGIRPMLIHEVSFYIASTAFDNFSTYVAEVSNSGFFPGIFNEECFKTYKEEAVF